MTRQQTCEMCETLEEGNSDGHGMVQVWSLLVPSAAAGNQHGLDLLLLQLLLLLLLLLSAHLDVPLMRTASAISTITTVTARALLLPPACCSGWCQHHCQQL